MAETDSSDAPVHYVPLDVSESALTGAAEALLAQGHQVSVIDNLSTGSIDNIALYRSELSTARVAAHYAAR